MRGGCGVVAGERWWLAKGGGERLVPFVLALAFLRAPGNHRSLALWPQIAG